MKHGLPTITRHSGEAVFTEGDPANGLYYLIDNDVKIQKYDLKEKTLFLWFAKPGELIGLTSFFQGTGNFTCSAVAGERSCQLIFFPNEQFKDILKQHPNFKNNILKMLCNRISFMEMRTKNMLYQNIDERLIETLLFLAVKESNKKIVPIQSDLQINYTKKELAEMVGASTEYLRRRIKELKDKKAIDYSNNWFLVKDLNRLRQLAISTFKKYN